MGIERLKEVKNNGEVTIQKRNLLIEATNKGKTNPYIGRN